MRRKADAIKQLQGTLRPSRQSSTLTYPTPTPTELKPPRYLDRHGRRLWQRLSNVLTTSGTLQAVDLTILGQFCSAFDGFMASTEDLQTNGYTLVAKAETKTGFSEKRYANPSTALQVKYSTLLAALGAKLGFSPRDRELLTEQAAPVRRYQPSATKKHAGVSLEDFARENNL